MRSDPPATQAVEVSVALSYINLIILARLAYNIVME